MGHQVKPIPAQPVNAFDIFHERPFGGRADNLVVRQTSKRVAIK